MMLTQVDRFWPVLAQFRVTLRADDSSFIDGSSVDDFISLDWHVGFGGGPNFQGQTCSAQRVELVKVETVRFPILVQAERQIETGLELQPANV